MQRKAYEAKCDRTLSGCCEKTTKVLCKFHVSFACKIEASKGIRTPNKTYAKALTMATQCPYEFARCKVVGRLLGKTLMAQGISYQKTLGFSLVYVTSNVC